MHYRLLGRSGLRVSELSLGTMTFGEDWGWGASKDDSRAMFDAFAAAGGNFIDTSSNYTNGTAESFVGDFVSSDRDYWVIATKYTLRSPGSNPKDLNAGGNARKNMMRTVEQSLRRLNTDHIDLLYLHMWDYSTPVEEVLRGFDDLVRAGKVLYVGFSDTPSWVVSRAQAIAELRGWTLPVAYQGAYNIIDRGIEADVLPMTRSLNMAVLAFNLLGGGALTGKFNQPGGPDEDTRVKQIRDTNREAAEVVVQVAGQIGRTPSQVAVNWVRQRALHIIPILGARRPPQLADTLAALDFTLDDEQMDTLNAVKPLQREYPHTFWNEYIRRDLIYGQSVDQLDDGHWPRPLT
jgi:aryl-alcohol dehydrogenase-like predicted oxidoreductase